MRHANIIAQELQARCEMASLLSECAAVGMDVRQDCVIGTAEEWAELERRMYGKPKAAKGAEHSPDARAVDCAVDAFLRPDRDDDGVYDDGVIATF